MNLESLLKPFKIAYEQVLRQYTKLTKKWEDFTGKDKYSLSLISDLLSCVTGPGLIAKIGNTPSCLYAPIIFGFSGGLSIKGGNYRKS